jgi:hypothetical protein
MKSCSTCGGPAVVQWQRRTDTSPDDTVPVYACADHALSPEAAAFVHEAGCPGPGKGGTCPCTPPEPEFPFTDEGQAAEPARRLPPGW